SVLLALIRAGGNHDRPLGLLALLRLSLGRLTMTMMTPTFKQIASGLRFPEGPVAMPDGSIILVEIERRTLSRVTPDGKILVVATLGGGPNGAAMGPGGKIYVTNNGGLQFLERPGRLFPGPQAADHTNGPVPGGDPER